VSLPDPNVVAAVNGVVVAAFGSMLSDLLLFNTVTR